MSNTDILSSLKPCPFCGAGVTRVDYFFGSASKALKIEHACVPQTGCTGHVISVIARDESSAISQWNARATGETA